MAPSVLECVSLTRPVERSRLSQRRRVHLSVIVTADSSSSEYFITTLSDNSSWKDNACQRLIAMKSGNKQQ